MPRNKETKGAGQGKANLHHSGSAKLLDLLETAPIKYRALVTLDMYSGLHRAELLGVGWRDIDMEHEVISVRRTTNHTARDGNYTDTTKSEKSVCSLKLPPVVFDVLKELKAYNEEQRERLGTKWVESDRLFIKWNGEPMGINTPYEWLKNFCKENDMPFCGVHGLRHFNASAYQQGRRRGSGISRIRTRGGQHNDEYQLPCVCGSAGKNRQRDSFCT